MKKMIFVISIVLLLAIGALHLHRFGHVHAQSSDALLHKGSSFDIVVKAPYSQVAPLFGAEGERAWGGADWDPHFVFPSPGRDVPGAIFTVQHGGHESLWVTPIFDLAGRHIQHLIIIPDAMVTQLDITFPDSTGDSTRVHVSYQRTALATPFNEHVERLSAHDPSEAEEWRRALDAYFATKTKR